MIGRDCDAAQSVIKYLYKGGVLTETSMLNQPFQIVMLESKKLKLVKIMLCKYSITGRHHN